MAIRSQTHVVPSRDTHEGCPPRLRAVDPPYAGRGGDQQHGRLGLLDHPKVRRLVVRTGRQQYEVADLDIHGAVGPLLTHDEEVLLHFPTQDSGAYALWG